MVVIINDHTGRFRMQCLYGFNKQIKRREKGVSCEPIYITRKWMGENVGEILERHGTNKLIKRLSLVTTKAYYKSVECV